MLQEHVQHGDNPGPSTLSHGDESAEPDNKSDAEKLREIEGLPTLPTNRDPGKSSQDRWATTTGLPRELSTVAYADEDARKTGLVESASDTERLSIACVVNPLAEPPRY